MGWDLLEEIWFTGSGLNQVISNCSTMFLLFWEHKTWNKFCHNTFHAKILCQNHRYTVVLGIAGSDPSSRTVSHWSLLIAACTRSTFSVVLLAAGLPECGSFSTDSWPYLKHLYHIFICAALTALSSKAFWIIWIVSVEECSSLTQNLMQIRCSTHSIILNAMTTQYTCSLNGTYLCHWLVQWGCHYSRICIPVPVHSPWLPGYIDVTQAVLLINVLSSIHFSHLYWHYPSPSSSFTLITAKMLTNLSKTSFVMILSPLPLQHLPSPPNPLFLLQADDIFKNEF